MLDISNNQLTGPFPAWVHRLRDLKLLNLGQNEFSGEIPLVIGEGRNLIRIRDFFRLIRTTDASFQDLRQHFIGFLRKYALHSRDMLWVDSESSDWNSGILKDTIHKYMKAEENRLLTEAFQNMLMDPLRLGDYLNSRPTKIEGTTYSQKRRRIA